VILFYLSLVTFNCVLQELLAGGGANIPRSIHEVVAHLACRLARWDDRLIFFTSGYQLRKSLYDYSFSLNQFTSNLILTKSILFKIMFFQTLTQTYTINTASLHIYDFKNTVSTLYFFYCNNITSLLPLGEVGYANKKNAMMSYLESCLMTNRFFSPLSEKK
jgi:hypothetical protein